MNANYFNFNAQNDHPKSLSIFAVNFQICMSINMSKFTRYNVHKGMQSHTKIRSEYLTLEPL